MYGRSLAFMLVLVRCFKITNAASTLDQIFDIKLGTANNGAGACDRLYTHPLTGQQTSYVDTLNKFWDDTVTLVEQVNIGLQKVGQVDDEGLLVRRNLRGWFGLEFDDLIGQTKDPANQAKLDTITDTFGRLQTLLDGNFQFKNPDKRFNRLFCEGEWAAETTNVYDNQGNGPLMRKKRGVGGTQVPKSVHVRSEFNGQLANGAPVPMELSQTDSTGTYLGFAYWIADVTPPRYMFLAQRDRPKPDPNNPAIRHTCADGTRLALTDAEALKDDLGLTLTFCNIAFQAPLDKDHQVASAPAPPGKLLTYDTIAESSQGRKLQDTIKKRQPRSLTMLHEFVHVVRDPTDSSDKIGRDRWIYGVTSTRKAAREGKDISKCPEPYAYFAYAYWLSTVRENPNDSNEVLYDWSSGGATK